MHSGPDRDCGIYWPQLAVDQRRGCTFRSAVTCAMTAVVNECRVWCALCRLRSTEGVDIHDSLGKGFRSLLRQVVPDAAANSPVRVFA